MMTSKDKDSDNQETNNPLKEVDISSPPTTEKKGEDPNRIEYR